MLIDYIKMCDIGLTNTVALMLEQREDIYLMRACVLHQGIPGAVRFHWRQPVIFVNPNFVQTPEATLGVIKIIERLTERIDFRNEVCHEFRWNGVKPPAQKKVFEN